MAFQLEYHSVHNEIGAFAGESLRFLLRSLEDQHNFEMTCKKKKDYYFQYSISSNKRKKICFQPDHVTHSILWISDKIDEK